MFDVTPLAESSIKLTILEYLNLPPKALMSDDCEYDDKALVTDVTSSAESEIALLLK